MRFSAESYVRSARWILGVGVVVLLVGAALLVRPGLREDYSIRSFVGARSAAYQRFERFLNLFVSNELAIIAVHGDDPLAPRSLALMRGLVRRIAAQPGVESVTAVSELPVLPDAEGPALLRMSRLVMALARPRTVADVLADHPEQRESLRRRLLANPLVADTFLSTLDPQTFAVLIQASGEAASGHRRRDIVTALRIAVAEAREAHPDLKIILAGPLVTMIDIFDYLHKDLVVFSVLVSGLCGVVLMVIFRRAAPLVVTAMAAGTSTLGTLGLAAALQIPASLITAMIVILVSIIAVAMCVHLIVAHEEVCTEAPTLSRRDRAVRVLRRAGSPCALVALTTGAGFGSLYISNLAPIRYFSLLILFGVFLALVFSTAAVVFLPAPSTVARPAASPRAMGPLLERLVVAASRRRRLVIVVFLGGTAVAAAGVTRLEFQSDFIMNFRAGSEVRRSYAFIQEHLAPLGSLEVVLTRHDRAAPGGSESVLRPELIAAADALVDAVVARFDLIGKGLSLADLLTLGGLDLPTTDIDLAIRVAALERFEGGRLLGNFVSADRSHLRINFRAREAGSVTDKLTMARQIAAMAEEAFPDNVAVEVTGLYPFYAGLIDGLLRDQYRSFGLAVMGIFAAMWIALRSLRLAVISMIPNLLPMVLTLGLMGWLGVQVNMATAMMLSVSVGIAVDNTIHYLWRWRRELAVDGDPAAAMRRTHGTVGRACVFSAVVIAGGFWILCLSEFLPTAYFGAMVGLTMAAALAADIVLLPVLLAVLRPVRA